MSQLLGEIFGELGISQYLDAFLDQGFDTWETILDITESDLDALGVKLGHRRKLQRRIANSRGLAPESALSPTTEDSRGEAHRPETRETAPTVITKRKYRRHPKPDENAPERPPSAYVLFSNKMREELKGRNLTFTEIAKLVGENWQNLSQAEKEPFETQAQTAKERYNQDLAEYKKTPEYKKYTAYLQEFKARHSAPSQDKDAAKRVKLSESNNSSSSTLRRRSSGSGSERGSEPPPSREQRVGSMASVPESLYSASFTPTTHHASLPGSRNSPAMDHTIQSSARSPSTSTSPRTVPSGPPSRQCSSWLDGRRADSVGANRSLPPLSDVFDTRSLVNGAMPPSEANGYGGFPRPYHNPSPTPGASSISSESRPPSLRKDYSSAGSSSSSSLSYPRTPIEGSLPIHALLSGKPGPPFDAQVASQDCDSPLSPDGKVSSIPDRSASDPFANGYFPGPQLLPGQPPMTASPSQLPNGVSPQRPPRQSSSLPNATQAPNLDGMSALLRAGEIVDRRAR